MEEWPVSRVNEKLLKLTENTGTKNLFASEQKMMENWQPMSLKAVIFYPISHLVLSVKSFEVERQLRDSLLVIIAGKLDSSEM